MKNKTKAQLKKAASWFTLFLVMACYVVTTVLMFFAHHVLTAVLLAVLFPMVVFVEVREFQRLNK